MDQRSKSDHDLRVEPIPADCLPAPHVLDALMRGPTLDAAGRVVSDGPWNGMTVGEVRAQRDEYNRICGE